MRDPKRILACGGRYYDDYLTVERVLDEVRGNEKAMLIEGGAPGADTLACRWARAFGFAIETYYPDFRAQGKAAGPIRNRRMLVEGKPDIVVAFPGGKGTADMVRQARKAGVPVIEVPEREP